MKSFIDPQITIRIFDVITVTEGPSAFGQAWGALTEEGVSQIGEADWNDTEEWSFGQ